MYSVDKVEKDARIRDMEMALRVALANTHPDKFLTWKSMFGGAGFFVDGLIFAAWFGAELALKLPEADRQSLVEQGGISRQDMGQYVEIPPGYLDNLEQLEPWVAQSVDYVLSPKRKKRR
jgi:TfoX/Sxy family transcriptional regulator of competence genes